MCNKVIREAVKAANIHLWQVADKLNMNDYNLSRKLRHELPEDETARILGIIAELSQAQEVA